MNQGNIVCKLSMALMSGKPLITSWCSVWNEGMDPYCSAYLTSKMGPTTHSPHSLLTTWGLMILIWEFPTIRGPNIDQIAGLFLQGHPKKDPQFLDTAIKFWEGSTLNEPYINH